MKMVSDTVYQVLMKVPKCIFF